MAAYKGIKGGTIQNFAGDPPAPINGQVWYNVASAIFNIAEVTTAGSWSTGGSLNTARIFQGGVNIGSAPHSALVAGDGPPPSGITEEYNGTAWTEKADLNVLRYASSGAGTTTAGLFFGGEAYPNPSPYQRAQTETWDGTSWAEVANLNTARQSAGGGGTQTSALMAAGEISATPNITAITESYNGTAWAEVADLNTARRFDALASADNTSAIAIGGYTTTGVANTESWNGTSWTEVNDLNTARYGGGGTGIVTAALYFGGDAPPGSPSKTGATEQYDGTSWTEVADLSTARQYLAGSGTTASAIGAGGQAAPGLTAVTEEWLGAGSVVTKTITTS
jgi:hypothetical protein